MLQNNNIGRCNHIFTRGINIGKRCSVRPRNGSSLCSRHVNNITTTDEETYREHLNNGSVGGNTDEGLQQGGRGIGIICMNPNIIGEINDMIESMISNGYENDYIIEHINETVDTARAISFTSEFTEEINSHIPDLLEKINDELIIDKYNIRPKTYYEISDESTCSICLENIFSNENTIVNNLPKSSRGIVTKCFHSFHEKCLETYFSTTNKFKCPMCRTPRINIDLYNAISENIVSGNR